MSKLIFTFEREWLKEARKQSNPVRKLERLGREDSTLKLIKSDFDSVTFEVEENERETLVSKVFAYAAKALDLEKPQSILSVGGDVDGMDLTNLPGPEDAPAPAPAPTPVPEPAAPREEKPADPPPPPAEEPKAEEPKAEEPQAEEAPAAAEEAPKPAPEPAKPEPKPQPKAETGTSAADLVARLQSQVPMKYAPAMADYLQELDGMIGMLRSMHTTGCVWDQNLLVAIDDGCGFGDFLRAVEEIYARYGLVENRDKGAKIKEFIVEKGTGEKATECWEKAATMAKTCAEQNKEGRGAALLVMDIRQWQSELMTAPVRQYLHRIAKVADNFICVFRVPFMEQQVVESVAEGLGDIMPIRTLVVPPVGLVHMADYFADELARLNCNLDDGCKDAVERWIVREKNVGGFYGYRTLDKMARQMVLYKAMDNCKTGKTSRVIRREDVLSCAGAAELLGDPYQRLERLVGLATVKARIREIVVQIKTQQELAAQGKDVDRPAIHMAFTGNPGTGKTTVARILADILRREQVLSKGLLLEVKGRDLCGRYVGETAPKTSAYCRDAYGSVLFVDEAYSLYREDNDRDYGKEVIETLLAEMENHREDFCVILAGYTNEMEELIGSNPGLRSRIPYVIEFPNYSREELEQIFFVMLDGRFDYDEGLREGVREFCASLTDEAMADKSFSNGRLMRNLFERAWGKAAYRRSLSGEEQLILRREDLVSVLDDSEFRKLMERRSTKRTIGF